jgi:hypothetical protein
MPDPKDESFFRKVVRFVANPATDWTELNSRQSEDGALELEKSELKAMVERKRRNDFVRKREFDMLRKVRREGLSPEQLAALGGSSRIDDSEARLSDNATARADAGVKAKIDEIEQQMVGENFAPTAPRRPAGAQGAASRAAALANATTSPAVLNVGQRPASRDDSDRLPALPPLPDLDRPSPAGRAQILAGGGLPPLSPMPRAPSAADAPNQPFAVEVSEVVHDPELDEAVIAFANADFNQCERALIALTGPGGERAQHAETWLALFDFYRATGLQPRFESLALDYAQQFGWSAPQWFSLPKLVSDAAAAAEEGPGKRRAGGDVGWLCPEVLDSDAVARLRSQTLQLPLPWVFDWSGLKRIDVQAATELSALFRQWATQPLDMRWLAGDNFMTVLAESAPTGVRDVDPALWLARLDALRLANRPDQFDEAAIDYCVTYEVSPPSWEKSRCQVRIGGSAVSTQAPPMSQVSGVTTSFVESSLIDEQAGVSMASVELSGQLVGDIGPTIQLLNEQLGVASLVSVSCSKLIRVDFVAAGDLLNWVLSKRTENRTVSFVDAHRLIALFFGAMGINEHAQVRVRNV